MGKTKICLAGALLCAAGAFALGGALSLQPRSAAAQPNAANAAYTETYRNQLAYSAKQGWNNDPNGLLYVPSADGTGGTYHMYYQYNYDSAAQSTANVWGNMSWGHATSTDLVHWEEQPVAIPAHQKVGDVYYDAMFSGSAVYDEHNTSGLFDDSNQDGVVDEGQGIIAILTQPTADQRQILAYSKDDGQSFTIWGEILGREDDGGLGDNEFRDPKVFWSETHNKWLMAVGGGAVRMYASQNLKDWEYLGQTGFWGECPDLMRFTVDGEEKYVLVVSPEDKPQSHDYNGTTRADTFYPAEYYAVGTLENGLFSAQTPLKRLSYGFDTYAFQSFNNTADGKVYGVSWAANWKTVGQYQTFREFFSAPNADTYNGGYNGGMTPVCELSLASDGAGGYTLLRKPVEAYASMREAEPSVTYTGRLAGGVNALRGKNAQTADMEITLDFNGSSAKTAQLELRRSAAEKTILSYDVSTETLTFDRSQSSLLAEGTDYFAMPSEMHVPLREGKLTLRILLDRAFVSVFANGGEASLFSAIFPSAVSEGLRLTADKEIGADVKIWAFEESFYGEPLEAENALVLTADKLDMAAGDVRKVVLSGYGSEYDPSKVDYYIEEGGEFVDIVQDGAVLTVTAKAKGYAKIAAEYGGTPFGTVDVYIYNAYTGDVAFGQSLFGFCRPADGGYTLSGTTDTLLLSSTYAEDFEYSAFVQAKNDPNNAGIKGQACGLMFGVSENYYDYYVATVDFIENRVKVWRAGVGDIRSVPYDFGGATSCRIRLSVNGGLIKVYIDTDFTAALVCTAENTAGLLGFNAYSAEATITEVSFAPFARTAAFTGESVSLPLAGVYAQADVEKVVNLTDGSARLGEGDYTLENGVLTLSVGYLYTLEQNKAYTFRVLTSAGATEYTVQTDFTGFSAAAAKKEFAPREEVLITLDASAQVLRVTVDGTELSSEEYTAEGGTLTLSEEAVRWLSEGRHTVQVYTDRGRPAAEIYIAEPYAPSGGGEEATHTFFYIDIVIFALFIVGYVGFAVYKRVRKPKAKKC